MTEQADQIRNRRQAFAIPGGSLDTIVRILGLVLPALVGAVAAAMLIAPLSPRGEVSFLLDRNKVAVSEDRLRVDDAMYRGEDQQGRPFSLSAGEAVQASSREGIVRLEDLTARLLLTEGPAVLSASGGHYDIRDEKVTIDGVVRFNAADGYRMSARGVSIDLPGRRLTGSGRVEGTVPAGTFQANSMSADLDARTITLQGDARLHMTPGRLQIP